MCVCVENGFGGEKKVLQNAAKKEKEGDERKNHRIVQNEGLKNGGCKSREPRREREQVKTGISSRCVKV